MSQYNLAATSNNGTAIKVVNAGDPETLVLNHSTKNTIYIGNTSAVGSGNLLDATPLDPYASIVVNGTQDVWAIAAVPTLPATVYTFPNSIAWTPKAIQPNIVDPTSPITVSTPSTTVTLTVPPTAQALALFGLNVANITSVQIVGVQSGILYYNGPAPLVASNTPYLWVPVLSDADTSVQVTVVVSSGSRQMEAVWIMSGPPPVAGPGATNVNIASIGGGPLAPLTSIPVINQSGSNTTLAVVENSKQMFSNQPPANIQIANQAAGNNAVILAASAGRQYFLHSLHLSLDSNQASRTYYLEDTSGNKLMSIRRVNDSSTGAGMEPALPRIEFHGAPVASGLGVQLTSDAGNGGTTNVFGFLTYSF